MSKKVKVQLTVSYDKIRQVMCLMSGKVLQDSELEELIDTETLNLESNIFSESKEEIEQVISAMILTQKVKEKEDLVPKKNKTMKLLEKEITLKLKRMLGECGFSIGQKVQVFDGQKWEKTGDIGDNECMWIEATITGCSVNDYKELLIEVIMVDGRTSLGYYKEGVRHFA